MESILDYMHWVKSLEEKKGGPSSLRYTRILIDFLIYVIHKGIAWEEIFTLTTLEEFQAYSGYKGASRAIKSIADYLLKQGRLDQPLVGPKTPFPLPEIYEQYLLYHQQSLQASAEHIGSVRRVLICFHKYLEKHAIQLCNLNIEQLDAFMATFKVSQSTRRIYRYHLRGFLKYLYHERRLTDRDLAPLLVGAPMFAKRKLPRFLRPQQLQQLFASLELSTPTQIRTYALVHIAYSLGLRPVEISKITLDDISFQKAEITLTERKMTNPITLPMPEKTIKAIALYVSKARPKGSSRHVFLTHQFPYHPISAQSVVLSISKAMKQAGLPSSAYWLRHTYAQNLLHNRANIYEVKEMLGHQNIQSSQAYLHIDVKLMRKVLFDEEF